MSRRTAPRRDPRLFRGDVVERLNVLQREGAIAHYQLPPRERGMVEVPVISVQVPNDADPGSSLAAVRDALQALPLFADLGGEIEVRQVSE